MFLKLYVPRKKINLIFFKKEIHLSVFPYLSFAILRETSFSSRTSSHENLSKIEINKLNILEAQRQTGIIVLSSLL